MNPLVKIIIVALCLLVGGYMVWIAGSTYARGLSMVDAAAETGQVQSINTDYTWSETKKSGVIKYKFNGQEYSQSAPLPKERVIKEGETLEVYINRANPTYISLDKSVDYDTVIVQGAFGLVFLTVAVIMLRSGCGKKEHAVSVAAESVAPNSESVATDSVNS